MNTDTRIGIQLLVASVIVLLAMALGAAISGCSTIKYGPPPEKLLLDATRPPDLYLADGSPCWYSRRLYVGANNRWFCEVHDEAN